MRFEECLVEVRSLLVNKGIVEEEVCVEQYLNDETRLASVDEEVGNALQELDDWSITDYDEVTEECYRDNEYVQEQEELATKQAIELAWSVDDYDGVVEECYYNHFQEEERKEKLADELALMLADANDLFNQMWC